MNAILEKPTISIVIPAFNESKGIALTVEHVKDALSTCETPWELIIVDDGSKDATASVISQLARSDHRIKGIVLSRNFGKESALFAGLQAATGQAVITIDADRQHPPSLIPELIEKWRAGAQIVHAVKCYRGDESIGKNLAAQSINWLISRLGGIDVKNSSDFKLLSREIVDIIVNQLPEKERFFRGLTSWLGFCEDYVYFDVETRTDDNSKWSFLTLLELAITALVSFTSLPLRIVTILGVTTLVLGFFIAGEALWSLAHDQAVSGFATIIITLLLIGSFIMISLGMIGEDIAKIYEEVKDRPLYFIKTRIEGDDNPNLR